MRRVRALLLLLTSALVLSSCSFDVYKIPLPGGADTGSDPMTVTVMFTDVLDLVPQSAVKVNDVNVGKVSDVELDGYTAEVTLEIRRDTDLPANTVASIRQTSLLGEKFVSLEPPAEGAQGELEDDAVIGLDRSGRNPEVEEVLGALSLLLNGGGVAQLRTIAQEINTALEGREDSARSVLTQIDDFTSQLDDNRADIVDAIESLDGLAREARNQIGSVENALDELPSAVSSIDRQREDLVRMLQALDRLSGVGTRVIAASKDATIETLRQLQPVLTQFANSGDDLVNSFNVILTYPFVDEVVGRDPQVARNLHMGDYVNLSVDLELDLLETLLPGLPCDILTDEGSPEFALCQALTDNINIVLSCLQSAASDPAGLLGCLGESSIPGIGDLLDDVLGGLAPGREAGDDGGGLPTIPGLPDLGSGGEGGQRQRGDGGDGLGDLIDGLGLNRPGFTAASGVGQDSEGSATMGLLMEAYDPALVSALVPPVVAR